MHFPTVVTVLVTALVPAASAFTCAIGEAGSCYFDDGNPVGSQQRCAVQCVYNGGNGKCTCPDTYPKNDKGWKYTGKHECFAGAKFPGRHKCHD